ncbi:TPA: ATP-grasp domain-containing protein [Serratia liquefaciens]|uniref:ATP-grasp domain-containing protein n=1 Tax=Serratia liquefaciens TaxID=614 RepID=UPI00101EE118|nr:ATP-grasp domain-containing protein [Serratia liquefaciens]MDU4174977.1 ATP-grasp domain-containing protein [Serratia liquefaciens]RYM70844.1 hypothetical protein BSQ99_12745 [Serratia liquefaciens]HEJ7885131.1 ATP-grasp domain-containing protein [Serratia liquefaciens]
MKHFVVVNNAVVSGIDLLTLLLDRGYRVSHIRNQANIRHWNSPHNDKVFARIHEIIDVPRTSSPEIVREALADLNSRFPVTAMICPDDRSLESTASAAETLKVPFVSYQAAQLARNKLGMRQKTQGIDLNAPWFVHVNGYQELAARLEEVPFPAIVKPVTSSGSKLTYIIRQNEDIQALAGRIETEMRQLPSSITDYLYRGFLIEQYMPGKMVSVEIGRKDNVFYPFMITSRIRSAENDVIELGSIMPSYLTDESEKLCYSLAEQALGEMGLDNGLFHVELMVTERGPAIIEINGRIGNGTIPLLYDLVTGTSLFEHLIDISQGDVPVIPSVIKGKRVMSYFFKAQQSGVVSKGFSPSLPEKFKTFIKNFEFRIQPGENIAQGDIFGWMIMDAPEQSAWSMLEDIIQLVEKRSSLILKKPSM